MVSERPGVVSERPRVVYVMGAGRSGSTILGVTLGNCENVFYAGELDKWLLRSGLPKLDDPERTRFWRAVRDDVDCPDELFGGRAHRRLERSSSLLRIREWPARRRLRPRYRRFAEDLYRAIARAANATHIVDTSHYPLRARELQGLDGVDVYLVFLVRDPQSVVASFSRDDVPERRFGTYRTNAYLWLTHLLSVFVFLRHRRDRRVLLRYEDFVADPEGVLRDILDRVGCDAAIPDLTFLRTGLPLHGNRLISSEVVSLERDAAAPRRSRVTALLQLPSAAALSRLRPTAKASPSPGRTATVRADVATPR